MRILALDISTSAGWALFEDTALVKFGHFELEKTIHEYGPYPWSYHRASAQLAQVLAGFVTEHCPDVVVIEETNLGKSRYSQKILEFTHKALLELLAANDSAKVIYLSSSAWRQALGLQMSKEDKRNNAKLSKAKKLAAAVGKKLDKKSLGIRGKVNKKHVAIRYVNDTYALTLKAKHDDIADAICLGAAYLAGALHCDGLL